MTATRGCFALCHPCPCRSLFLFSSCGSLLCALTLQRMFVLGTAIPNTLPWASAHIPSVPPAIPHTTHTYYTVHTTHPPILFCISQLSYCITQSSLTFRSICVPFFISRFRSFCPNSISFTFPLLSLPLFPPHLLCEQFDLCSPVLSPSFSSLVVCSVG